MKHAFRVFAILLISLLFIGVQLYAGQCAATTKKGSQCKRQATVGSSYCWQHVGKSETIGSIEPKNENFKKENTRKQEYVSIQCEATTKKGAQCKRRAKAGSKFCWQHGG